MSEGKVYNPHAASEVKFDLGSMYADKLDKVVSLQLALGVTDVDHTAYTNLRRKAWTKRSTELGAMNGGIANYKTALALRGISRDPIDQAREVELENQLRALGISGSAIGFASKLIRNAGVGAELTEDEILRILQVSSAELLSVIATLCEAGTLKKRPSRKYVVTGTVHFIAPLESCIREYAFEISRTLRNNTPPDEFCVARFFPSETEADAALQFMRSKEIEDHIGLSKYHNGGVYNYAAMLVVAPVAENQSADSLVSDSLLRFDQQDRKAVICVSCADLGIEDQRRFESGAIDAFRSISSRIGGMRQKHNSSNANKYMIVMMYNRLK